MSNDASRVAVLVVEDSGSPSADWNGVLGTAYAVERVDSAAAAHELLGQRTWPIVVAGAHAGEVAGELLLAEVARLYPHTIRLMSADATDSAAAIRGLNQAGIFAFVPQPLDPELTEVLFERATAAWQEARKQAATLDELRGALGRMETQIARVEAHSVACGASIDPLTDLWDRQHLIERLEDEANRLERYGTPFGVVWVEVPHEPVAFEAAAASLLRDFLRRVDVSARLEDRTFVVVCPNTDDPGMRRLPERLLGAFTDDSLPGWPAGQTPPLVVATATLDQPPAPPDEALDRLRRARRALQSSSGVIHFDPSEH